MVKKKVSVKKEEVNNSFFQKMKDDKKYSAKVQLFGYGILIVFLITYLNVFGMTSSSALDDDTFNSNESVNEKEESINLLQNLSDNYTYDINVSVDKKSMNTETGEEIKFEQEINYKGKSYDNKLEIIKKKDNQETFYYKFDNNYYSKIDNVTTFVKESVVYDIIDGKYIEVAEILELINKASLDHVTDYSSGRKEYVYHLKVKDIIVSYKLDDVVEIDIEEENGILKIDIDYSNLIRLLDESIIECKLESVITDINNVEDFEVIVNSNNENDNR